MQVSFDEDSGVLTATNPYSLDYSGRTAFFTSSALPACVSASRREFLGRNGTARLPLAVATRSSLSNTTDTEGDPCATIAVDIEILPDGEGEVTFLLGDADTREEALALVAEVRDTHFTKHLKTSIASWRNFVDRIEVQTPDQGLNHLVNSWLPYQTLSCRLRARAGFYQASGAFGFRDQLQDALAFLIQKPELARRQILTAAGRQFEEGDVQHWWLPKSGAGIRSTISDDVVWLAYAISRYVESTGEKTLLDETVAFLDGPPLGEDQHDSFFEPQQSSQTASLYEHAARALDLAVSRTGSQGLPLILGGDWNDGMNRVGVDGGGESVWLGWFLSGALESFLRFAEERGDKARVIRWTVHREELQAALETAGWDGNYYRRGYFDDGTPLGSAQSEECRIDSLPQSWSILAGDPKNQKARGGVLAAYDQLVDEENGVIRLFTPAFSEGNPDPGYIRAYPPGVRENGGQYTHAAIWLGIALARIGDAEKAWRCFSLINPINHALDEKTAERYRVEPYVVAADVYSSSAYPGRGGWTWYTGSAGWLYQFAVGEILGIQKRGNKLYVNPVPPPDWSGFSVRLQLGGKTIDVVVEKSPQVQGYTVRVNGDLIADPASGYLLDEA